MYHTRYVASAVRLWETRGSFLQRLDYPAPFFYALRLRELYHAFFISIAISGFTMAAVAMCTA